VRALAYRGLDEQCVQREVDAPEREADDEDVKKEGHPIFQLRSPRPVISGWKVRANG